MFDDMTNCNGRDKSDLLTPAQASRMTGLTTSGLAKMADQARLSSIRPSGTHRRYLRTEIEALTAGSIVKAAEVGNDARQE